MVFLLSLEIENWKCTKSESELVRVQTLTNYRITIRVVFMNYSCSNF